MENKVEELNEKIEDLEKRLKKLEKIERNRKIILIIKIVFYIILIIVLALLCPSDEIGIHNGLKIRRNLNLRVGSTPTLGTTLIISI